VGQLLEQLALHLVEVGALRQHPHDGVVVQAEVREDRPRRPQLLLGDLLP
jgi:hypothetical protein